jgi:hypothetical protein
MSGRSTSVQRLVHTEESIPKDSVTLLEVCDTFSDLVNLASYIGTQNVRVLLQKDAFTSQ